MRPGRFCLPSPHLKHQVTSKDHGRWRYLFLGNWTSGPTGTPCVIKTEQGTKAVQQFKRECGSLSHLGQRQSP
jgi:hypothetical protein